jgi:SAM-dependent methyltransferase
MENMQEIYDQIRRYWDHDAATYDDAGDHVATTATERAAWTAALTTFLPANPANILDVGAGTGFLSLMAAALGHKITALDISEAMLERLTQKAENLGVQISTVKGRADSPPPGPFDVVMERHLMWTLPEPAKSMAAWRAVAADGRLLAFEGIWGGIDRTERLRQMARAGLQRLRRVPPAHHGPYPESVTAQLHFTEGLHPNDAVTSVEAAGWHEIRLHRLRDVEWARSLALPPVDRLLGVPPLYVIVAE